MDKFLGLWDLHYGYDKITLPSGKSKIVPVHSVNGFHTMMEFARWYKPSVIILGGDNFDMRPVCRHDRGLPKKQEGQRLVEVYQKGWEFFLEPLLKLPGHPEVHWFDGNHEAWSYQLANEFPGIDGMIDPYTYLELKDKGIVFHPQGDIWRFGKLGITHGDGLVRGAGLTAAKQAVTLYGSSIRLGHFHSWQVYTKPVLKDADYVNGVVVPSMCTRAPSYSLSPVNTSVNGFLYGVVYDNGKFDDAVVLVRNGRCSVAGKEYAA
jgi:hypothetical protein